MDDFADAAALHRLIGLNATWPELAEHYLELGYRWDEIVGILGLF
jgi:hypothetical protein